jgi:hypothetical protein
MITFLTILDIGMQDLEEYTIVINEIHTTTINTDINILLH